MVMRPNAANEREPEDSAQSELEDLVILAAFLIERTALHLQQQNVDFRWLDPDTEEGRPNT